MFKRTYGILYEQNSEVFTDLFRDLEDYYARGKLDLEEAMDHFFTALYQRMFTVLNAQFRFDDKYGRRKIVIFSTSIHLGFLGILYLFFFSSFYFSIFLFGKVQVSDRVNLFMFRESSIDFVSQTFLR